MQQHLGLVLKSCCGLICDESSIVRVAVLQLFRAMLQRFTGAILEPHTGLVMMYICSGVTHLVESVRFHALDLLECWIAEKPLLVARYTPQVLPNLVSLVHLHKDVKSSVSQHLDSTRATTRASGGPGGMGDGKAAKGGKGKGKGGKAAKPERRLRLFRAVRLFLTEIPPLYARGAAQVDEDVEMAKSGEELALTWGVRLPAGKRDYPLFMRENHGDSGLSWKELGAFIGVDHEKTAQVNVSVGRSFGPLCRDLFPSLMEHWLQCVPSEYPSNSANDGAAMELILAIVAELHNLCSSEELAASMVDAVAGKGKRSPLEMLQRYVVVHFPFRSASIRLAGGVVHDPATALNRHICLVLCKYVGLENTFDWAEKLFLYCTEQLSAGKEHADGLLIVVEKLVGLVLNNYALSQEVEDSLEDLLEAFTAFFFSRHFRSAAKSRCVAFIHDTLSRAIPQSPASPPSWRPSADVVKRWTSVVPKLLWQLKASKPDLTAQLLEVLVLVGKTIRTEEEQANFDAIQSSLVPFFFIEHKGQCKFGPFTILGERARRLAAEVLFYFSAISAPMLFSVSATFRPLVLCRDPEMLVTALFLLEVTRQRHQALDEMELVIFYSRCLLECTAPQDVAAMDQELAQRRVAAVVERISMYIAECISPTTAVEVLLPGLEDVLQDPARTPHPLRRAAVNALLATFV